MTQHVITNDIEGHSFVVALFNVNGIETPYLIDPTYRQFFMDDNKDYIMYNSMILRTPSPGRFIKDEDKGETQKEVKVTKNNSDGSSQTTNTISITEWEKLASGESEHMSYTVTSLLSENNDTAYENKVKITKVSLDRLSTLQSNYEWGKDETTLTITPPTGGDRRPIYWVAGTLGLIVLAGGIIFIKKKLLKK